VFTSESCCNSAKITQGLIQLSVNVAVNFLFSIPVLKLTLDSDGMSFLRNASNRSPIDTASHLKKYAIRSSPLFKKKKKRNSRNSNSIQLCSSGFRLDRPVGSCWVLFIVRYISEMARIVLLLFRRGCQVTLEVR
jgi:hypothetical protein